ncbi:MAG TPA: metallophosphoesterase [Vicinamibacterales bacterium]|nr:metallophosphoesterase [Vicinamibacterales bacterium]
MLTSRNRWQLTIVALVAVIGSLAPVAQETTRLTLPNQKDSVHFAVIGDSGTGGSGQSRVARRLTAMRSSFPFDIVLMLGDNLYGGSSKRDYVRKFEEPYKDLLSANVKFYAALGNHDDGSQVLYKPFNMDGKKYYTFKPPSGSVRFFALDSNYVDKAQLDWLEKELAASGSDWKIMFFHHPLYSSGGRHGSNDSLREQLEPIFVKHGVDVVFAGHDHFYERIKPQQGIYHFVSGGAAKLRTGDIRKTGLTDKGFDRGYHFMLVEVTPKVMYFQVISDTGATVDSGELPRREPAGK